MLSEIAEEILKIFEIQEMFIEKYFVNQISMIIGGK